jgi:hypothetical protein
MRQTRTLVFSSMILTLNFAFFVLPHWYAAVHIWAEKEDGFLPDGTGTANESPTCISENGYAVLGSLLLSGGGTFLSMAILVITNLF